MKKIISLFLSLLIVFSGAFGVACSNNNDNTQNPPAHECDYDTIKYDETQHWQECSCGNKASISSHSFTSGICSCGYVDPNFQLPTPDTPTTPEDAETIMRFVVTSDTHYRGSSGERQSADRLASIFESAYDYADNQTEYKKLDGIFFVGDNTDNGKEVEQTAFFKYVNENTREGTFARAVMGNHEYIDGGYEDIAGGLEKFLKCSGYEDDDIHFEINDYHFIMLSIDNYKSKQATDVYLTSTKIEWLKTELNKAVADDPTGEKPIFVFQHVAPANTMLGSNIAWDTNLKTLLDGYPNVVDFSGHTHLPLTDPGSIWQGTFTALQTGSMAYLDLNIAGHPTYGKGGVVTVDENGGWFYKSSKLAQFSMRNAIMYYICELDENNVLTIKVINALTGNIVGDPYVLDSFGDPSGFDYTDARKENSVAPTFKGSDAITVKSTIGSNVSFSFPQASCKDVVQNYRIDVYEGATLVKTEYRHAGSFWGDLMPETMNVSFGGLKASTKYTLKIFAVNSFAKESAPLTKEFTTDAYSANPVADVFSVKFNADGSATDTVTNTTLTKKGAPAISDGVATFDGNDAFVYEKSSAWYPILKESFTIETYVNQTTSVNKAIVGSMEYGGFGLHYKDGNYRMMIYGTSSESGQFFSTPVSTGVWTHFVGVYDGTNIHVYINGVLMGSKAIKGAFNPSIYDAQSLVVGADANGKNTIEDYGKCQLKSVNIYSGALTQEQITNLCNSYSN